MQAHDHAVALPQDQNTYAGDIQHRSLDNDTAAVTTTATIWRLEFACNSSEEFIICRCQNTQVRTLPVYTDLSQHFSKMPRSPSLRLLRGLQLSGDLRNCSCLWRQRLESRGRIEKQHRMSLCAEELEANVLESRVSPKHRQFVTDQRLEGSGWTQLPHVELPLLACPIYSRTAPIMSAPSRALPSR